MSADEWQLVGGSKPKPKKKASPNQPLKHSLVSAGDFLQMHGDPQYRIKGVREFWNGNKESCHYGACLMISGGGKAPFLTHFHAHYSESRTGAVTQVASAHFKVGMAKGASQGFDIDDASAKKILTLLLNADLPEEGFTPLK